MEFNKIGILDMGRRSGISKPGKTKTVLNYAPDVENEARRENCMNCSVDARDAELEGYWGRIEYDDINDRYS